MLRFRIGEILKKGYDIKFSRSWPGRSDSHEMEASTYFTTVWWNLKIDDHYFSDTDRSELVDILVRSYTVVTTVLRVHKGTTVSTEWPWSVSLYFAVRMWTWLRILCILRPTHGVCGSSLTFPALWIELETVLITPIPTDQPPDFKRTCALILTSVDLISGSAISKEVVNQIIRL